MYREACYCAATSKNIVDLAFLPKGLHDIGAEKMLARLQQEADAVDTDVCEAIVMGYGLCNNGTVGLRASAVPLVLPRAHDCITLFFGSKERYREYFDAHPGAFYITTGWQERDIVGVEQAEDDVMHQLGLKRSYEDYVAQYGEDNAKFIMETLGDPVKNYTQYTYLSMGIAEHLGYGEATRGRAAGKGWDYDGQEGDIGIIRRLFDGEWSDEEFLTVQPGQAVVATNDDRIVAAGIPEQ